MSNQLKIERSRNPFDQFLTDFNNNISLKKPACTDTLEGMAETLDILIATHERQKQDNYVYMLKCLRSSKTLFGELARDFGVNE